MVYYQESSAYAEFVASPPCIATVGLGYVGLPLSQALCQHFDVIAYDRDAQHVDAIQKTDPAFEVTHDVKDLARASIYIIAVPTPVLEGTHTPDFSPITDACKKIASILKPGDILSFESTVYPTTLDDICTPILEEHSSLKRHKDFFLAYAPERISPGSHEYTLEKLPRIVAADSQKTIEKVAFMYGTLNQHQIMIAPSIQVAEAAKLLENVQRDVNIALMNEVSIFCDALDISVRDVIDVAASKPNFYHCYPGLVGGHCVGVDPYYLLEKAKQLGTPQSMASQARVINENMALHFAQMIHDRIPRKSEILACGVAFKANIDDIRNAKAPELILRLQQFGHHITVIDEEVDHAKVLSQYKLKLTETDQLLYRHYDAVVVVVGHESLRKLPFEHYLKDDGIILDLVGGLPNTPAHVSYWKP